MKCRSLWAGYVARIGRARRKFLENVRLEDADDGGTYTGNEDGLHYGEVLT